MHSIGNVVSVVKGYQAQSIVVQHKPYNVLANEHWQAALHEWNGQIDDVVGVDLFLLAHSSMLVVRFVFLLQPFSSEERWIKQI